MESIKCLKNIFCYVMIIAFFAMISCSNGDGENGGDPRPTGPEPMSAKTAMQYFREEGIKIGINLGNSLDAVDSWSNPGNPIAIETAWWNPQVNQMLFNSYRDFGFNAVRILVTWVGHIGPAPDYKVSEVRLRRVAEVVNMAHAAGLKALINIHHDDNHSEGFGGWLHINEALSDTAKRNQITDKYVKVWTQIAEYFVNYGDYLIFQGFNEIHDSSWDQGTTNTAAKYEIINDWNQRFTNAVRSTGGNNEKRYLMYYGYMVSRIIAENDIPFVLPSDPIGGTGRQMVGFHLYTPTNFSIRTTTHEWPNNEWDDFNDAYSGTKAFIDDVFGKFKTKFTDNGIPVILGENGPAKYVNLPGNTGYNVTHIPAARQNRLNLIDYFYTKARENEIVPFFWENGHTFQLQPSEFQLEADFGLFNRNNGQPNSAESREVIERMMAAINNTTPGTPAVFSSWYPIYDNAGSSITHTTPSGRQRIHGTIAGSEGHAFLTASPDPATLTLMRTMTSFSFIVSGDGKQYDVMIPTTESLVEHNHYRYTFTAPAAETKITVNVPANLTQGDWGGTGVVAFIQNNVQNFQFQLSGTGTFDLTVWDIKLH